MRVARWLLYRAREVWPLGVTAPRGFAWGAERRAAPGGPAVPASRNAKRARAARAAVLFLGAGAARRRRASASASVKRDAKRWFAGKAGGRSRRGARAVGEVRSGWLLCVSREGSLAPWRDRAARLRAGCRAPGRARTGCVCFAQCGARAGGASRRFCFKARAQPGAGAARPRGAGKRAAANASVGAAGAERRSGAASERSERERPRLFAGSGRSVGAHAKPRRCRRVA